MLQDLMNEMDWDMIDLPGEVAEYDEAFELELLMAEAEFDEDAYARSEEIQAEQSAKLAILLGI